MNTADLEGAELDLAVAVALGLRHDIRKAWPSIGASHVGDAPTLCWVTGWHIPGSEPFTPSTDWAQGGPIIERERIELLVSGTVDSPVWLANPEIQMQMQAIESEWQGPTPLIAAMRAFVASRS